VKIAIVTATFYQSQGADRVAWKQANALARQGNKVTIFTFTGNMQPPKDVSIELLGAPQGFYAERIFRITLPLNFIKLLKCVPKLKGFDIVYAHAYPASWLAYLAKRFYGIKYIHYFHHLNPAGFVPGLIPLIYQTLHIFLEKWTITSSDGAITVSQFAQAQLKDWTGLDSKVVYNTIDCHRFRRGIDRLRIRAKYNLGDDPVVLFVGGLSPQKGIHLLIKAFNLVKRNISNAKLLIVGKHQFPDYSNMLRQMADASIVFAGEIPDEDIPFSYAACDIFATATAWEGFNLPLAEAQACGKPVVAFNLGPHPEVVKDGKTGFLVPPQDYNALADAMTRLLKDAELRQEMGESAYRMIRDNFSE